MKQSNKLYFPALDGLRFLAFLLVFLHHVSFYLETLNPFWSFFRSSGWIGVDIFFVLTGFLVTILLLQERAEHGHFSLKRFLLRRTLRIWPLYFMALLVGYVLSPQFFGTFNQNEMIQRLSWYLVFLGNWNVVFQGYGSYRAISELWAISVDQQFYIFWPLVLLYTKTLKKALLISSVVIVMAIVLRAYLLGAGVQHPSIYTNTFARMDVFLYGALLAFVYFFKQNFLDKLQFLYSQFLQALVLLFLGGFLYLVHQTDPFAIRHGIWGYVITGSFITYLVLCCIKDKGWLGRVGNVRMFRELGKVSYGLYIWHVLALELVVFLFKQSLDGLELTILALPLTILFGYFSYNFFEKPFLNLKSKF